MLTWMIAEGSGTTSWPRKGMGAASNLRSGNEVEGLVAVRAAHAASHALQAGEDAVDLGRIAREGAGEIVEVADQLLKRLGIVVEDAVHLQQRVARGGRDGLAGADAGDQQRRPAVARQTIGEPPLPPVSEIAATPVSP